MRVEWTQLAIDRIYEIAAYIAQDNARAAERWVERVFARGEELNIHHLRLRRVPESNNPAHREIIFGNYRLIYKVTEEVIFILTVRHFKQILPDDEMEMAQQAGD